VGSFNIVEWQGQYYGVPHGVAFNFGEDDFSKIADVAVIGATIDNAKKEIIAKYQSFTPNLTGTETVGAFNIISWEGRYYGIPHGVEFNFAQDDFGKISDVAVTGATIDDVKKEIIIKYRSFTPNLTDAEMIGAFNIVNWEGRYYGIPHGVEFNFAQNDFGKIADVAVTGSTIDEVKKEILAKYRSFTPHAWGMEDMIQTHAKLEELDLPEVIEIEPIHSCNFRCVMCHVPYEKLSKKRIDVPLLLKQLQGLEGRWVTLASSYEPTVHPDFVQLANGLTDIGVKLDMCTNGSLFSEKLISRIRDVNLRSLSLSFDGATKTTYESIRPGGNFDQVIERVGNLRQAFAAKNTYFSVNQTVMRSNIQEIRQSVDLWERMDFDHLGLIYMRIRNDTERLRGECLDSEMDYAQQQLNEAALHLIENNFRLVLSSSGFQEDGLVRERFPEFIKGSIVHSRNLQYRLPINPREYFQNGAFPGMQVACRSPFKFAKIDYDGSVILCQRYAVGNIYEADFKDIWFGAKANNLRKSIMTEPNFCYTCDHYKYCIKAGEIDLSEKKNFLVLSDPHQNFDVPTLIKDYAIFSIYKWGKQHFVVPKFGGGVVVRMLAGESDDAVYQVKDVADGIRKCDELLAERSATFLNALDEHTGSPEALETYQEYALLSLGQFILAIHLRLAPFDFGRGDYKEVLWDTDIDRLKTRINSDYSFTRRFRLWSWILLRVLRLTQR